MMKDSDQRKFKRGPLLLPVIYNFQAVSKDGSITDLSAGGCRLYCYSPDPVKSGETIDIFLNLKTSQDMISLKAQIVRVSPFLYNPDFGSQETINYELGVKFLKVNERQQEAIENYTRMVLRRMKQG
jgi:c-di-GMP-binding flagellar brake protein YcgR